MLRELREDQGEDKIMEVAATEVIEIGTESHQEEQGTNMVLLSRQSGWSELRTCQAELVGRT